MSKILKVLLLAGGLTAGMTPVQAKKSEADMTFHGTLIEPPPCTLSDGHLVEVDFGKQVGINKVNGVNYRRGLNYQITCESAGSGNWVPKLSLSGDAASFDKQALRTNNANLGIRVYQNDTPFTPNSTLTIDPSNPPRLEVVPVKQAGATVTEGAFEAWATLRAEYQ